MIEISQNASVIFSKKLSTFVESDKKIFFDELKRQVIPLFKDESKTMRFLQNALSLLEKDDILRDGSPSAILGILMHIASLDLSISRGEVYVYSRWDNKKRVNTPILHISYQGWLTLIYRTGLIADIKTKIAIKGDNFNVQIIDNTEFITHDLKGLNEGKEFTYEDIIFSYVIIKTINGGIFTNVLSKADLEKLRKLSPSQSKDKIFSKTAIGIWAAHPDKQCWAKNINQIQKFMPKIIDAKDGYSFNGKFKKTELGGIIEIDHDEIESNLNVLFESETKETEIIDQSIIDKLEACQTEQQAIALSKELIVVKGSLLGKLFNEKIVEIRTPKIASLEEEKIIKKIANLWFNELLELNKTDLAKSSKFIKAAIMSRAADIKAEKTDFIDVFVNGDVTFEELENVPKLFQDSFFETLDSNKSLYSIWSDAIDKLKLKDNG